MPCCGVIVVARGAGQEGPLGGLGRAGLPGRGRRVRRGLRRLAPARWGAGTGARGFAEPGERAAGVELPSRLRSRGGSHSAGAGEGEGEAAACRALGGPSGPGVDARRGLRGLGGRGGKCGGGALQQGGRGEGQPLPRDPFIV